MRSIPYTDRSCFDFFLLSGHHLYVELVDSEGNNVAATLEKEGYSMLQRDTDSSSTSSSTRSSLSTSSVTPSSSTDSFVSVTTKTSSASSSGQSSAVSTSDSIRFVIGLV